MRAPEGRNVYRRTDRHVVIRDNAGANAVACAILGDTLECRTRTLPADAAATVAIVIEK